MHTLMIVYMFLYIAVVFGAALYSFFKSKKMNALRLGMTVLALLVVTVSLLSYIQAYQPLQMLGFALGFTSISSLFLYNSLVGEGNKFTVMFGLSLLRLVIHLQLLVSLYIFR
ncbi:hypothetical protein [Streptococcus sp. 20-1249]|uniref:hypothetical protein n=1 Tax=Streptococcus hepaticus TaxID=3349163 RepID=UPI0037483B9B